MSTPHSLPLLVLSVGYISLSPDCKLPVSRNTLQVLGRSHGLAQHSQGASRDAMDPPTHLSDGAPDCPRSSCSLVAELAWASSSSSQPCSFTRVPRSALGRLERTSALVLLPSSSMFSASQVLVTMRSLWLLFLWGLLWTFCASGARAKEPGASFSHPGSVGLDKNTVHDQEYVFSQGYGPGASLSAAAASCKGSLTQSTFLPLFVRPLDIFHG